jgi:signal transduction histidine kinase
VKRGRKGKWPLLPIGPLIVTVVGLGAALIIVLVATRQLQTESDGAAALRSKTLAATLAARAHATPHEGRKALLVHAASRTGAGFVLIDRNGAVHADYGLVSIAPAALRELSTRAEGISEERGRRLSYAVSALNPPLEHLLLVAFVDAPWPADGTIGMTNAIGVLTLLMLGVAIVVALVFMSATRDDVSYVRQRIAALARPASEAGGVAERAAAVPVRSFDQVGALTAALNALVARFAAAERGYRKDLNAAAQIDTERSQFLAGLSHELRTPLNAILGFTHLLESESDGPLSADALEALEMIRTSGEHLKSLIDDILDLSAAETGQLRLTRNLVNVYGLADEVVRQARATITHRPVRVFVEGDVGAIAWADARRLRQVLTNLVSNALKATAQGDVRIRVAKDKPSGMTVLEVADDGKGIDPAALKAIFEPYQQAGDEISRRGGAGLGLAITRQLVLLHGGTIAAESTLGKGSKFTLQFPDQSAAAKMPRDSLVPWTDEPTGPGPEPARDVLPSISTEVAPDSTRYPRDRQ